MSWRLAPVSAQASGMPAASTRRWYLEPGQAAVDRARARRGAPFLACTWLESATARPQVEIAPA